MKIGRIAVVVAALSLSAMAAALTGTARAAASAPSAGVVSMTISPAAQAAALAYWTPARMEAATPLGSSTPAVTARSFIGLRSVGALFLTAGGKAHFCTASIISSAPRNVLLTVAHCVYHGGLAKNIAFVPEYDAGKRPYGTYAVAAGFVTRAWMEHADISQDFSFLQVDGAVQNRVGAALNLGIDKHVSQKMVAIGYNDSSGNPIWCPTKSFQPRGLPSQMEFQCDGFWSGTSGAPWIEGTSLNADGTVFGGIGGYEQGGHSRNWSYGPKFTVWTKILYNTATRSPCCGGRVPGLGQGISLSPDDPKASPAPRSRPCSAPTAPAADGTCRRADRGVLRPFHRRSRLARRLVADRGAHRAGEF